MGKVSKKAYEIIKGVNNLKPCPFCGGLGCDDLVFCRDYNIGEPTPKRHMQSYYIKCYKCKVTMEGPSKDVVISNWNRRKDERD